MNAVEYDDLVKEPKPKSVVQDIEETSGKKLREFILSLDRRQTSSVMYFIDPDAQYRYAIVDDNGTSFEERKKAFDYLNIRHPRFANLLTDTSHDTIIWKCISNSETLTPRPQSESTESLSLKEAKRARRLELREMKKKRRIEKELERRKLRKEEKLKKRAEKLRLREEKKKQRYEE